MCLRVVQMKGVDLRLFQFDWNLTFAVIFMNADGTIYGRYGTRAGGRNNQMTHVSSPSLQRAMQRALQLHKDYPANRDQLRGKRGPEPPYRFPEQMPDLKEHATITTSNTWNSCIQCHQVGENLQRVRHRAGKLTASDIWVYPLPENIGLRIDKDDGLLVRSVVPNSPAAKAGFMEGDALKTMNGQPLLSQADIQWVLQNSPMKTEISVRLERNGRTLTKSIVPSGNWKETDLSWRAPMAGLLPGLHFSRLSNTEKQKRGIAADQMAFVVKYVQGDYGKAGVRQRDVVIAVDGRTNAITQGQFLEYVGLSQPPKEKVTLTLLRGDQRLKIAVPVK